MWAKHIFGRCFQVEKLWKPPTTPPKNQHDNGTSPFLIGDTSSNGWFSIVMLVFSGVHIRWAPIHTFRSQRCSGALPEKYRNHVKDLTALKRYEFTNDFEDEQNVAYLDEMGEKQTFFSRRKPHFFGAIAWFVEIRIELIYWAAFRMLSLLKLQGGPMDELCLFPK